MTKEKDLFVSNAFHWKSVAGSPFRALLQLTVEASRSASI